MSDVESSSNKKCVSNEEDEELATLRLAALLSRRSVSQKKEDAKVPNTEDQDFPHSSYIRTQTGPPRNFRVGRRRGIAVQKSSHRSNLIVINPVTLEGNGSEHENDSKSFPKLVLPQHKWCLSGTEDSMSPKSSNFKKKDAGRFSRFESDSDSESDVDINSTSSSDEDCPSVINDLCAETKVAKDTDEITSKKVPFKDDYESPTENDCLVECKTSVDSEEHGEAWKDNNNFEMTSSLDHFHNAEPLDSLNSNDYPNASHMDTVESIHPNEIHPVPSENKTEVKASDLDQSGSEHEKGFDQNCGVDQDTKVHSSKSIPLTRKSVADQVDKESESQKSDSSSSDSVSVNNSEQLNNSSHRPQHRAVSSDSSSTDLNEECQKEKHSLSRNDLRIRLKKRKLCRTQLEKQRTCSQLSSTYSESSTSSDSCYSASQHSQKGKSSSSSSSRGSSPSSSDESYTPTVKSILSVVKPVSLENSENSNMNVYKKRTNDICFSRSSRGKRNNVELRLKQKHAQSADNHKAHPYINKELIESSLISEKKIRSCTENKPELPLTGNSEDFDSEMDRTSRKRLPVHMRLGVPIKKRYVEVQDSRNPMKNNQGWSKETAVDLQPANLRIIAEVHEDFSDEEIDLVDKRLTKNKQRRALNCGSWKKKQNSW